MVVVDSEHIVTITGISHQGAGIARINNLVVFVAKALLGEVVRIRLTEIKKNLAKGELLEIITPQKERIASLCAFSEICGGCELQHASYSYQLDAKRQIVAEAFQRLAKIDVPVAPVIGMETPWRYRNKGVFHADYQAGKVVLGFYQQGSHQCHSASQCLLFSEEVNRLVSYLEKGLQQYSPAHYVQKIMIRQSSFNGEMMLVFVTKDNSWRLTELVKNIITDFPQVISIYHNINTNPKLMLGKIFHHISGREKLHDTIGDFHFQLSPQSFFQVNNQQTQRLYQKALELAQLTGTEQVVDAYCGIGTISLYLAQQTLMVYGVESVSQAVKDAQQNAHDNHIANCQFITAKAEDWLPKWLAKNHHADVIVVDPPRKGCDSQMLHALANSAAEKIVYISCEPSTLARDVRYLQENGYQVQCVQPVDLFSWSWHVETVCLLSKLSAQQHIEVAL